MKSYQACFMTTVVKKQKSITRRKLKKTQTLGAKQHATKQPVGELRNQKENEKIPW